MEDPATTTPNVCLPSPAEQAVQVVRDGAPMGAGQFSFMYRHSGHLATVLTATSASAANVVGAGAPAEVAVGLASGAAIIGWSYLRQIGAIRAQRKVERLVEAEMPDERFDLFMQGGKVSAVWYGATPGYTEHQDPEAVVDRFVEAVRFARSVGIERIGVHENITALAEKLFSGQSGARRSLSEARVSHHVPLLSGKRYIAVDGKSEQHGSEAYDDGYCLYRTADLAREQPVDVNLYRPLDWPLARTLPMRGAQEDLTSRVARAYANGRVPQIKLSGPQFAAIKELAKERPENLADNVAIDQQPPTAMQRMRAAMPGVFTRQRAAGPKNHDIGLEHAEPRWIRRQRLRRTLAGTAVIAALGYGVIPHAGEWLGAVEHGVEHTFFGDSSDDGGYEATNDKVGEALDQGREAANKAVAGQPSEKGDTPIGDSNPAGRPSSNAAWSVEGNGHTIDGYWLADIAPDLELKSDYELMVQQPLSPYSDAGIAINEESIDVPGPLDYRYSAYSEQPDKRLIHVSTTRLSGQMRTVTSHEYDGPTTRYGFILPVLEGTDIQAAEATSPSLLDGSPYKEDSSIVQLPNGVFMLLLPDSYNNDTPISINYWLKPKTKTTITPHTLEPAHIMGSNAMGDTSEHDVSELIDAQTQQHLLEITRNGSDRPRSGSVADIADFLHRARTYSLTPDAQSGLPHTEYATDLPEGSTQTVVQRMAEKLVTMPYLKCDSAMLATLLESRGLYDQNPAVGYLVNGDAQQAKLGGGNAHTWLINKHGLQVDPTPGGSEQIGQPDNGNPANRSPHHAPNSPSFWAGVALGVAASFRIMRAANGGVQVVATGEGDGGNNKAEDTIDDSQKPLEEPADVVESETRPNASEDSKPSNIVRYFTPDQQASLLRLTEQHMYGRLPVTQTLTGLDKRTIQQRWQAAAAQGWVHLRAADLEGLGMSPAQATQVTALMHSAKTLGWI